MEMLSNFPLLFLYSIGWTVALFRLKTYLNMKYFCFGLKQKYFCWLIFCIPLGKLLFFHYSGLIGLKITFFLWALIAPTLFIIYFLNQAIKLRYFLIFCLIGFFPFLSLGFLNEPAWLFIYNLDGQTDSLLLRYFSLCVLILFMLSVFDFCETFGARPLIRAFVDGVVTSSLIGVIIFALVYFGWIGAIDLMPISADTHIVSSVYRFNPGANVNEFGIMAVYALFLIRQAYPTRSTGQLLPIYILLFFAIFFSLTRAAWLAYIFALSISLLISRRNRLYVLSSAFFASIFVWLIYLINDDFNYLVTSRFAFEGGASGNERIEKIVTAFFTGNISVTNFLFGNGWATNLYLHSVPLQLIYEIGFIGFLFISLLLVFLLIKLATRTYRGNIKTGAALSCVCAFLAFSAFHHTIYHMQSWFIMGLAIFFANQSTDRSSSAVSSSKEVKIL